MKLRSDLWLVRLTEMLVLAAVYYGAARLAQYVAIRPGNITPVWPASGISLAAFLQLGYRVWPGIWLGEFLESTSAFLGAPDAPPLGTSLAVGAAIGGAVLLEYFSATFLLRRFVGHRHLLDRAEDIFKFVALAGIVSCAAGATAGVTSLCVGGLASWSDYPQTWLTWMLGDTVGMLVVTPAVLTWSQFIKNAQSIIKHRRVSIFNRLFLMSHSRRIPEAAILLVLVLAVCQIAFGGGYPVAYLVIPLLVWAVFRFGKPGATLLIVFVSGAAIWGTVHGHGPFIRETVNESLLLLQSYIGVVSVTTVVLAAVLEERQLAQAKLQEANDQLELRVEERTTALIETNHALQQSESQLREKAIQLERTLRELQQTQSQLIQTEKMSSLGQLVAGIAHEINNPVSFIYGNLAHADEYIGDLLDLLHLYQEHYPNPAREVEEAAEEMDLDFLEQDLPKLLGSMRMGADRIRQIVLSLRNFSRLDESDMKPVDIHEGLESTLLILQNRLNAKAGGREIQVIKEYGNLPLVQCYAGQLNQVFMNILTNAIDVLENQPDRRTITIRTELGNGALGSGCGEEEQSPAPRAQFVAVRIADSGPGMTDEVRKCLFDPFFTTKPVGKGTGLGLSISYQIVVEKHGGKLRCVSAPGEGAEFVIEIPVQHSSSALPVLAGV